MFTVRIKTQNNNYIVLENQGYGSFSIMWCDEKMNPFKTATTEEWLWACSSWESKVEQGEWENEEDKTVYFGDHSQEEPPFVEFATVKLTGLTDLFREVLLEAEALKEDLRDNDDLDVINISEMFSNKEKEYICSLSPYGYVIFDHMQHHGGNEWSLEYFDFQYI